MRSTRLVVLVVLIAAGLGLSLRALPDASTDMANAARAFLDGLPPELRAKATFALHDEERLNFHFIPRERQGVSLKELDQAGRERAHALLRTGLSQRGYLAATTIIELENVLRALEMRDIRDPGLYYVSIFGTPGSSAWGWRFEGHHLSLNFTVADGRAVAWAPAFFGANPAVVRDGPMQGTRALADVEDLARALVLALDGDQRRTALFSTEAPRDIITGAERQVRPLEPVGIAMRDLRPNQREMLVRLIDAYLDRMAPALASARRQALTSAGLDDVRFGWAGVVEVGGPHYYRVQGPTFLIEYDNVQNNNNHIHSIWRDFHGDFGRDLLSEHYAEYPH